MKNKKNQVQKVIQDLINHKSYSSDLRNPYQFIDIKNQPMIKLLKYINSDIPRDAKAIERKILNYKADGHLLGKEIVQEYVKSEYFSSKFLDSLNKAGFRFDPGRVLEDIYLGHNPAPSIEGFKYFKHKNSQIERPILRHILTLAANENASLELVKKFCTLHGYDKKLQDKNHHVAKGKTSNLELDIDAILASPLLSSEWLSWWYHNSFIDFQEISINNMISLLRNPKLTQETLDFLLEFMPYHSVDPILKKEMCAPENIWKFGQLVKVLINKDDNDWLFTWLKDEFGDALIQVAPFLSSYNGYKKIMSYLMADGAEPLKQPWVYSHEQKSIGECFVKMSKGRKKAIEKLLNNHKEKNKDVVLEEEHDNQEYSEELWSQEPKKRLCFDDDASIMDSVLTKQDGNKKHISEVIAGRAKIFWAKHPEYQGRGPVAIAYGIDTSEPRLLPNITEHENDCESQEDEQESDIKIPILDSNFKGFSIIEKDVQEQLEPMQSQLSGDYISEE